MTPRNDYGDIASILQAVINPLMGKIQTLDEKVDHLNQDRVTRTDIEKLRSEIVASFVPRDAYEPRHSALIDRDAQLETALRELRKDIASDIEKIHTRLEVNKQQVEDRIKSQQDVQLSTGDRRWLRLAQTTGGVAVLVAILDFVLQHIRLF